MAALIRAVLWDLDGTLVDSEAHYERLERQMMLERGVSAELYDRLAEEDAFSGLSTRDIFRRVLTAWDEDVEVEHEISAAESRMENRILTEVVQRSQPKRGANRVLTDLPMREFQCAIVTSSRRRALEAIVERFGWSWRMQALVSADDVSRRKPSPEPYLLACERLGIGPQEALAVEDTPIGVQSARSAGVRVAGVVGTVTAEALTGANWVISDLGAVPGLLRLLNG